MTLLSKQAMLKLFTLLLAITGMFTTLTAPSTAAPAPTVTAAAATTKPLAIPKALSVTTPSAPSTCPSMAPVPAAGHSGTVTPVHPWTALTAHQQGNVAAAIAFWYGLHQSGWPGWSTNYAGGGSNFRYSSNQQPGTIYEYLLAGGGVFQNRAYAGSYPLPTISSPDYYNEYDMNSVEANCLTGGVPGRNAARLVRDRAGHVYATFDHYATFYDVTAIAHMVENGTWTGPVSTFEYNWFPPTS